MAEMVVAVAVPSALLTEDLVSILVSQVVEDHQELGHKDQAAMVVLTLVAAVVVDPTTTDLIKVVTVVLVSS